MAIKAITFIDIRDFENKRRDLLSQEKAVLETRKRRSKGLPPAQQKRLDELIALLAPGNIADPVFRGLQDHLQSLSSSRVGDHDNGKLPTSSATPPVKLTDQERQLAAVYGILQLENLQEANQPRFVAAIPRALGEYTSRKKLYDRILIALIDDGDIVQKNELNTRQWMAVARQLHAEHVSETDSLLPLKVRATLAKVAGASDGAPTSALDIVLPNLEATVDQEIVKNNILAMQSLYFAMEVEAMGLWRADECFQMDFQRGHSVLARGSAGDKAYERFRKAPFRFTEIERKNLFAQSFGIPGGDKFDSQRAVHIPQLMFRCASAASWLFRRIERSQFRQAISQEPLRQAARDLAHHLSLHGFGIAYFAAKELQQEIDEIISLLSDPEVLQAYGARDIYQLIEQLILYSGGQVGRVYQKRVTANAGAVIIRWLAERNERLRSDAFGQVLDVESVFNPVPAAPGHNPLTDPTDTDFVNACEQLLAINGMGDAFIEERAQAMEPPRTTTRPIQMPSIARDVLESVGISAGHGNGNSRVQPNGRYTHA